MEAGDDTGIHVSLLCPSQHLQHHESGVEGESCYYHCVLCNYSTKAKLNLIQHVRSMKHQRSESLRKLQRLQKGLPEEEEDLGQIFTIRKCPAAEAGECCLPCVSGVGSRLLCPSGLPWQPQTPCSSLRLGGSLVSLPCCGDDAYRLSRYVTGVPAARGLPCPCSVQRSPASRRGRL